MAADQEFQAGLQHHQAGRWREAEEAYRRALAADVSHTDAWERLGILLHQSGRTDEAIDALKRASYLWPQRADYLNNLGAVLAAAGRKREALDAFMAARANGHEFPETYNNIGNLLRDLGRTRDAIPAYRKATWLRPDYADAWNSLGMLLRVDGDLDGAEEAFSRATGLRPHWPEALNNLAGVYQEKRRVDEAVALFRRALSFRNEPRIWDNLLLAMYGQEAVTAGQIREAHDRWNAAVAAPLERLNRSFGNDRHSDRPLRIGYASPDFREHPVGYLMTPVLANHDPSQFEVFCYSEVKAPDAVTRRHRELARHWVDATGLSDEQLALQIERDRIDVLIDLALHTANNRLLVFARRPAPVQLTWAGYPGSTGLHNVDYRITDPYLDPHDPARDAFYSEKLIRLPACFWCFGPRSPEPPVNALPAARDGVVTFGCLNQFGKITDATLNRWAAVMRGCPGSRLRVLAPRGRAREDVTAFMAKLGIDGTRIGFMDRRPRDEYLKLYHQIDICLDTFPYTAHTTALDALWMGVPVVTLAGQTAVSRGALSILTQVGLGALCAERDSDFVRIAVDLAADFDTLSQLRSSLRDRLISSPVADSKAFTRAMESAIRFSWRAWCVSR